MGWDTQFDVNTVITYHIKKKKPVFMTIDQFLSYRLIGQTKIIDYSD